MIKRAIVFGLGFLLALNLLAQGLLDSSFTRDQLTEDLKKLRATIESSHPDPYVFCTEKKFDQVFTASIYALDEKTNLRDFSLIVSNLLSVLRDSHTAPDYGQLQNMQMDGKGYYMPLNLERVERTDSLGSFDILVKSDWEDQIPKGSKLLAINGDSISALFKKAMIYACIEGDALDAQRSVATAILPIIAGLHHPYGKKNSLTIAEFGSGKIRNVELRGYNSKEYLKKRLSREKLDENKSVDLDFEEGESLAVLRVTTFAPPSTGAYRKSIRDNMQKIIAGGYDNLVIDIRNNGGGSSAWVEYLYSFIDTSGYNTPSNVIAKNSKIAMERSRFFNTLFGQILSFVFYRNNEDVQSFRHFSQMDLGAIDTVFFHKPTRQMKSIVFTGNCYLLINGLTASAGVDFTNAFKSRERGYIVGEQCLGPVTGTFGNPAAYTLPNSKLRVSIATIRYNYDNTFEYDTGGIVPDFVVDCTPADLHDKMDTQLEFVKKLIEEKK